MATSVVTYSKNWWLGIFEDQMDSRFQLDESNTYIITIDKIISHAETYK